MKKKQPTKNTPVASKPVTAVKVAKSTTINTVGKQNYLAKYIPLILCALLGLLYWQFALSSDGLYQHDEVGHMREILEFWERPMYYILSLWSRGGYKILYALPTLGGINAVIATNIILAVGTAYLVYLISKGYGLENSWLAILLFGLQPFVINLSFRCYSELPAMFFTALFIWLYQQKKWMWASIVVSFLFMLRTELAIFSFLFIIPLIRNKKWYFIPLLGWTPVLLFLLSYVHTGQIDSLIKEGVENGITKSYKRSGFFYFWYMLPEIVGVIPFVLFVTGLLSTFFGYGKKWVTYFAKYNAVVIIFLVYFLMHCVFTSKSFGFGHSGGLGRFMLVITPCIAILALMGFNYLRTVEVPRLRRVIIAALAIIIMLVFFANLTSIMPLVYNSFTVMAIKGSNILFILILAVIMLLLIFTPAYSRSLSVVTGISMVMLTAITVKPIELTAEDDAVKLATEWYWNSSYRDRKTYGTHTMAIYYSMRLGEDYKRIAPFDSVTVVNAKKGDIFLYDSHYSGKYVKPEIMNKLQLKLLKKFGIDEKTFMMYVVEKP